MEPRTLDALARFSPEKMQKVPVFDSARMLCDVYCLEPGQAQKVHAHDASDKVYLCVRGALRATIGAQEIELAPGQAVLAPAGVPHGVRNDGAEQAMAFVVTTPKP